MANPTNPVRDPAPRWRRPSRPAFFSAAVLTATALLAAACGGDSLSDAANRGAVLDDADSWHRVESWSRSATDGPVAGVSFDGGLWFFDNDESPDIRRSFVDGERTQLSAESLNAAMSGNGRIVVFRVAAGNDEWRVRQVASGEEISLGRHVADRAFIDRDGTEITVLTTALGNSVNDVEFTDGHRVRVRTLFDAIAPLPATWLAPPQLHDITPDGSVIAYRNYQPVDPEPDHPTLAALVDGEPITLAVADDVDGATRTSPLAVSSNGERVVYGSENALVVFDLSDGTSRELGLTLAHPEQEVVQVDVGETKAVVVAKRFGETTWADVLVVDLDSGATDTLVRVAPLEPQQITPGGILVTVTDAGHAAAVSVAFRDRDHPAQSSWSTAIIDLDLRPEGEALTFAGGTYLEADE